VWAPLRTLSFPAFKFFVKIANLFPHRRTLSAVKVNIAK